MNSFVILLYFIGFILIMSGTEAIGEFYKRYKVMLSDVYFIFMSIILLGFLLVGFVNGYIFYNFIKI